MNSYSFSIIIILSLISWSFYIKAIEVTSVGNRLEISIDKSLVSKEYLIKLLNRLRLEELSSSESRQLLKGMGEGERLTEKLLESRAEESRKEIDRLWAKEAERQVQQIKSGEVKAIPGKQVFE